MIENRDIFQGMFIIHKTNKLNKKICASYCRCTRMNGKFKRTLDKDGQTILASFYGKDRYHKHEKKRKNNEFVDLPLYNHTKYINISSFHKQTENGYKSGVYYATVVTKKDE